MNEVSATISRGRSRVRGTLQCFSALAPWRGVLLRDRVCVLTACLLGISVVAQAVSVGERSADNSVEAQMEAFRVHEDFEVSLFADESMGIANPVAMHWDHLGRLWVLTTLTYAQLEPGEKPNDTLVILEDTDKDGRADQSTVFADGLEMPMGFALGYGGVFLGEGPDLLFLKDEDGDDQADTRELLLTGFGTGDTHQNISNFTWGPDGRLYFSQGLHCYSRVETPWGIVRGETAGFFRLDPVTLRLEPFCFPSQASQNPCGIVFDPSGAMFLKSNNRELIYVTPGLVPTTRKKNLVPIASIGATPGKSMGGEYVDSAHLPDWIQDSILIAGYYANRVTSFPLKKEGAGYSKVEPIEILTSEHGSFRPVEIRIGPDGAIYVADWFNPIIGHYQASLRHPDRDEEHGRIWRVSTKGRALNSFEDWAMPETAPLKESPSLDQAAEWVVHENPRKRLDGIVAAAQLESVDGLTVALKAIDSPRDRFIDYALEQLVHSRGKAWLDSEQSVPDSHLLFVLKTLVGPEAVKSSWDLLSRGDLDAVMEEALKGVIAASGSAEDLLTLLQSDGVSASLLKAMAEGWQVNRTLPANGFEARLVDLIQSEAPSIQMAAMELAGRWNAASTIESISQRLYDDEPIEIRKSAILAMARLERGRSVEKLLSFWQEPELRPVLTEALAGLALVRISGLVAHELKAARSIEEASDLILPLLNRKGGAEQLAKSIKEGAFNAEQASDLVVVLSQMGRNDEALLAVLQDAMGVQTGARAYSPDYVGALVDEVNEAGSVEAGAEIYLRAELTCVACHQVDGIGGIIGPPLDAVGAGLTTDLLIESILWPQRQLKEGYFSVSVSTKGGETFAGYRENEENGVFFLKDTATGEVRGIPRVEISRIHNAGSLMPAGLTNGLSREELRDLVAYLASLKG